MDSYQRLMKLAFKKVQSLMENVIEVFPQWELLLGFHLCGFSPRELFFSGDSNKCLPMSILTRLVGVILSNKSTPLSYLGDSGQ